jgi:hypothetical protein
MLVNEKCAKLHELFNKIHRREFAEPDINSIGFNYGIYIIFEKGETAHGELDRIVRVGTTTGEGTILSDRLKEHLENKGRSVFRNNIALCLLNKGSWLGCLTELFKKDSIYRAEWEKTAAREQLQKYQEINDVVSSHIREKCTFAVINTDKENCKIWENKIISTVSSCPSCGPSSGWLGNSSPKPKIKNSGLWNIIGVGAKYILTDIEFRQLCGTIEQSIKTFG